MIGQLHYLCNTLLLHLLLFINNTSFTKKMFPWTEWLPVQGLDENHKFSLSMFRAQWQLIDMSLCNVSDMLTGYHLRQSCSLPGPLVLC